MENSTQQPTSGFVQFVLTGEYYENLIKDSFSSGEFKTVEILCQDADLPDEMIKKVFRMQFGMSGASNEEKGIQIKFLDESPEDFAETLMTGIRSCVSSITIKTYGGILETLTTQRKTYKNGNQIAILLKYFTVEEISQICREEILNSYGLREFKNLSDATYQKHDEYEGVNGVVLPDGKFIMCGYQQHGDMFPILHKMGLVDTSDAYRSREGEDNTVHISSNSSGIGRYGHAIENGYGKEEQIPDAVYKSMWGQNVVTGFYMAHHTYPLHAQLISSYVDKFDQGTKYGNLMFLKNIASDLFNDKIKLVNFSTDYADITTDEVFVRTSPKYSIAGLLNSIKVSKDNINSAHTQIAEDFEKVKDVVKYNEIHSFYQDFIEGKNGVANMNYFYKGGKLLDPDLRHVGEDFRAMVSRNQGDIVAGKVSKELLSYELAMELEKFMKKIVKKVKSKIQVEFVTNEDETELTIVQLRVFKEIKLLDSRTGFGGEEIVMIGKTFNQSKDWQDRAYRVEVNVEDILIVDSEADSKDLIGKKALIVRKDIDFSHILALSTAMGIPSIYGVYEDKLNLDMYRTVIFDTKYLEGCVFGSRRK